MGDNSVEYRDWVKYPHTRLRVEIMKEAGVPERFVVRLERRVDDGWHEVVRFDHDPENPMGHDITEERLHMDVYRRSRPSASGLDPGAVHKFGEKARVKDDFPHVKLTRAPRYCIAYIEQHADTLLRRFEKWHDLNQDPTGGRSP